MLSACTTPFKERLARIDLGMDKTDVIDELGSPQRSFRSEEQDIWIYRSFSEDAIELREIGFKDGFVNYIGDPRDRNKAPTPPASQEEAAQKLEHELKPVKQEKAAPQFHNVNEDGSIQ